MSNELTVSQQLTTILAKYDPSLPVELLDNLSKEDKMFLLKELLAKNVELNLLAKKASLDRYISEETIRSFYKAMQNELPRGNSVFGFVSGSEVTGELKTSGVGYDIKIEVKRRY